jgi:spore germination cell wall hydrolase CwlJ-like protein
MPDWKSWGIHLLALVAWREARGEGSQAMLAVGCCFRNRANNPKWWGTTLAEVLTKKWQVSSMTDPKDPQLSSWPKPSDPSFGEALRIAGAVDAGETSPVRGADSYYDTSIAAPIWATPETFVGAIGRIRFHNTDHDHEMSSLPV